MDRPLHNAATSMMEWSELGSYRAVASVNDMVCKAAIVLLSDARERRIAMGRIRKTVLLQGWSRGRGDSSRQLAAHASLTDPPVALSKKSSEVQREWCHCWRGWEVVKMSRKTGAGRGEREGVSGRGSPMPNANICVLLGYY